uniref:follistatin-related protein 3 n=1 Tax=Pristiophorus japonicus TaxID=55135 RepID=UPI00398E511C
MKLLIKNLIVTPFFFEILCILIGGNPSYAGVCWLQQGRSGKCQALSMTRIDREECCSSGSAQAAWTSQDIPESDILKLIILGGINCYPCHKTCEGVDCGPGKICKMNKHNKPTCICAPDCSNVTKKVPVCGTDGKVYKDECGLLLAKCRGLPELEVQYQGECKKSCTQVLCPGTSMCVIDQTHSAHCVMCRVMPCPEPLSSEQALCGNNGITYHSVCHLRRATCLLGKSIGVAHYGRCNSSQEGIKQKGDNHENMVFSKLLLGW